MDSPKVIQHFILTRFNLLLWTKDKEGNKVRNKKWLEHRFSLFEKYCLPSIIGQTNKDFEWIVLFDSTTPEEYKKRVDNYQKECSQLIPVYVEPRNGRYFAEIFRQEVVKRLNAKRIITSYLDNDDALNVRFVEDLRLRVQSLPDGTFINYIEGYQFYTDYNYVMKINFPRNHFMSVVERGTSLAIKTIYGYGSHYYIDTIKGAKIKYVYSQPMWCEVIHDKNMGNDAYFLNARMVKEVEGFGFMFQNSSIKYGVGVYLFHFLPRYIRTFVRRIKIKLRGYRFE